VEEEEEGVEERAAGCKKGGGDALFLTPKHLMYHFCMYTHVDGRRKSIHYFFFSSANPYYLHYIHIE
jgi:hypothetical protein